MHSQEIEEFVDKTWSRDVLPTLIEYVAIPCKSPDFDPNWAVNGHMDRAVTLMLDWARKMLRSVPNATAEAICLPNRTPVLLIEIPGCGDDSVLIYGHLDKQPEMDGWAAGRTAWAPAIEGDRLYGRGGADDGYALFSAITAILALREQRLDHARCTVLIEACEESGSKDLPYYLDHFTSRIGEPAVVIALDAGCPNYDQLWLTTSLRGQVAGALTVRVLANAASVMQPMTTLKLSLRLPPTLDPEIAALRLKNVLESDPPYRCDASFRIDMISKGWHSRPLEPWLDEILEKASLSEFGAPTAMIGGGGGIPFLAMLGERFPETQFVAIGVLGPQSNAHGPNEFLHIPTAKRITTVVAHIAHAVCQHRRLC